VKDAALPVLLISAGVIWLLFNLGLIPDRNWIVSGVLVGAGAALFVIDGLTKKTVAAGGGLIAAGIAWIAHFEFAVRWRMLAPSMLIVVGCLLLVARLPSIPERRERRD
jgi:hypothetical protein